MSNGELLIAQLLSKAHIPYAQEKTFADLKHGKFRYDFYTLNLDGARCIIEVNGAQHYQQIVKFQPSRQDFLKQKEHDRRKISYALSNNIPIYCIPFWELSNIHTITDLFSSKFRATTRWHNDSVWEEHLKHSKN